MRPVVLTFARYYAPAYRAGGPVRSLTAFAHRLSADVDVRVVCQDRDLGDAHPYPGVRTGEWTDRDGVPVLYLPPRGGGLVGVVQALRQSPHDVVYLNSLLDAVYTTTVLLARRLGLAPRRPVVLAPRGEFSSGAWALRHPAKRLYLAVLRSTGMLRGVHWQASASHEAADILRHVPGAAVSVVPNLAVDAVGAPPRTSRAPESPLRVVVLGRLSPMKNLEGALRSLALVRAPVQFTIYGPIEDAAYWASCGEALRSLPGHVTVDLAGEVAPDDVPRALAGHDLFFLPTRGENYGHAIREALAAGLPVLLSDQTPWHAVETAGVGWTRPVDDVTGFAAVIDEVSTWDQATHRAVSDRARSYAASVTASPEVLQATRDLFLGLAAQAS